MRIGIDFDNTIICYDKVFNKVGMEKGLIPDDVKTGKGHVRDFLRQQDMEEEWIWLQGYVYGSRLLETEPYNGVKEFLSYCEKQKIDCFIVSHKTVYPYSGDKYNLHEAAYEWIREQKMEIETFFELTKEDKVRRISDLGCNIFIDDLPEFLSLLGFPPNLKKVLFDPLEKHVSLKNDFKNARTWKDILTLVKTYNI